MELDVFVTTKSGLIEGLRLKSASGTLKLGFHDHDYNELI